jgi:hypothetical protein
MLICLRAIVLFLHVILTKKGGFIVAQRGLPRTALSNLSTSTHRLLSHHRMSFMYGDTVPCEDEC